MTPRGTPCMLPEAPASWMLHAPNLSTAVLCHQAAGFRCVDVEHVEPPTLSNPLPPPPPFPVLYTSPLPPCRGPDPGGGCWQGHRLHPGTGPGSGGCHLRLKRSLKRSGSPQMSLKRYPSPRASLAVMCGGQGAGMWTEVVHNGGCAGNTWWLDSQGAFS